MDLNAGKKKKNMTKGIARAAKERKKSKAEIRNTEYAKPPPKQKIARLDKAGLVAAKELAKIQKLL